ncbi:methyltransferase domain-containing protein [Microvirga sp. HBU67558]|uniref:RsmB/NOP family class I SAM-dependent RNA methyltransferase n=1 Tax=Microvirga TaxID=186650 RepID=UPI001B37DC9C|nr:MULTISPECIES: transcription antitermination factor NusB [unclassified Microvirga]MBQ0821559.1 methyltransferase domain-containing protein [Microvirga sp. HBU67558]
MGLDCLGDSILTQSDEQAGLGPRRLAWQAVTETLKRRVPLDDVMEELLRADKLSPRDEALARAIAIVTFRRLGTLGHALRERLNKPPKDERLMHLLAVGAAQILFLDVPDHAAVDSAVEIAQSDPKLHHAGGFINAVLRRVAREREQILAQDDPWLDTPTWLEERWIAQYGEPLATRIAQAHRSLASVDLTVKGDPQAWAERLGGVLLPTGSIRLKERTAIRDLPGFEAGEWWVQDAAAALPARLLQAKAGERVADLCAAPGGKTAQLAAAGAEVLAVDRSAKRLQRLEENLARLHLTVDTRAIDAEKLTAGPFDAILLDAPCSATGTIRRHPDVAWTKSEEDIRKLAGLQSRLLDKAAALLKPGGRLVYCTCSLEAEEGERQAEGFLARHPDFARNPVAPDEIGGLTECLTPAGDLRTLPSQLALSEHDRSGLDGFFVARFVHRGS